MILERVSVLSGGNKRTKFTEENLKCLSYHIDKFDDREEMKTKLAPNNLTKKIDPIDPGLEQQNIRGRDLT